MIVLVDSRMNNEMKLGIKMTSLKKCSTEEMNQLQFNFKLNKIDLNLTTIPLALFNVITTTLKLSTTVVTMSSAFKPNHLIRSFNFFFC